MQSLASGMVVSVTRSQSVPECRLVEFWDMRAAEQVLAALNGATARVPTIVEVHPSQHCACVSRRTECRGLDLGVHSLPGRTALV